MLPQKTRMPDLASLVLFPLVSRCQRIAIGCISKAQIIQDQDYEVSVVFGDDVDPSAFAIEHDVPIDQREQCIVFALPDTLAWVPLVANLSNQDVAGDHSFTAKFLYTKSLGVGITTVSTGALSLFMGH